MFTHWDNMSSSGSWGDHRRSGYIRNRAFESKLIWYFTGVCINRLLHNRLWIWILSSRCSTRYLTRSLYSLVRYRVHHLKIKFISLRGHAISTYLYDKQDTLATNRDHEGVAFLRPRIVIELLNHCSRTRNTRKLIKMSKQLAAKFWAQS